MVSEQGFFRVEDEVNSEARQLKMVLNDLLEPRPIIYWSDFILSTVIGWCLFCFAILPHNPTIERVPAFFISSLVLYRTLFFNHEIAHIHKPWIKIFAVFWNVLCGIVFFQPTSSYGLSHLDHHRRRVFATESDPRYVPLGRGTRAQWLVPLFVNIWIAPLLLAFRFLVIGPASILIGGRFRRWVIQHASTIALNLKYVRALPSAEDRRWGVALEMASLLFWVNASYRLAMVGQLRPVLVGFYLIFVLHMGYNYIRSLVAHRYIHSGGEVSFQEQILDSITIPTDYSLAGILAPIGLRYHSLHHLMPNLPYHSMTEAHRRLMLTLSHKHPYRNSLERSVGSALGDLWRRTGGEPKLHLEPENPVKKFG